VHGKHLLHLGVTDGIGDVQLRLRALELRPRRDLSSEHRLGAVRADGARGREKARNTATQEWTAEPLAGVRPSLAIVRVRFARWRRA
jgi:hypothetical protein